MSFIAKFGFRMSLLLVSLVYDFITLVLSRTIMTRPHTLDQIYYLFYVFSVNKKLILSEEFIIFPCLLSNFPSLDYTKC